MKTKSRSACEIALRDELPNPSSSGAHDFLLRSGGVLLVDSDHHCISTQAGIGAGMESKAGIRYSRGQWG